MDVGAIVLATLSLVVDSGSAASGSEQNYGDFHGTNALYLRVIESNSEVFPLFGPPGLVGDTLDFDPGNFKVQSSGAQGPNIRLARLAMSIASRPGSPGIQRIVFRPGGDFTLNGLIGQSAQVSVSQVVNLKVTHVSGTPVNPLCEAPPAFVSFNPVGSGNNGNPSGPSGGEYQLPGDAGTATPFQGLLDIDVPVLVQDCGLVGEATGIDLQLDGELKADSMNGGSAFIAVKDSVPTPNLGFITTIVPEPGAVIWLIVIAMPIGRRIWTSVCENISD